MRPSPAIYTKIFDWKIFFCSTTIFSETWSGFAFLDFAWGVAPFDWRSPNLWSSALYSVSLYNHYTHLLIFLYQKFFFQMDRVTHHFWHEPALQQRYTFVQIACINHRQNPHPNFYKHGQQQFHHLTQDSISYPLCQASTREQLILLSIGKKFNDSFENLY